MNDVSNKLLKFLRRKKTIVAIIIIVVGSTISSIFSAIFQKTIRVQEIESVVKIAYKNKQFENITESEFQTLLKSKEPTLIGFIDVSDNKAYTELTEMFVQKESISDLPQIVYIYQPIYNNAKLNKELDIKDKNTFLVIDEKKELGRYSFNELPNGYEEAVKQINTVMNPKIPRKEPVRKDIIEQNLSKSTDSSSEGTSTSEVQFE